MRIIISPAKKMNIDTDTLEYQGLPVFLKETEKILDWMKTQSYGDLQKLWGCNDKIAEQNFKRITEMDLHSRLTPAILSYEGIAFQYMAPAVFENSSINYVQEHLRILSGFYGVLKPMDGVTPYRLEMSGTKLVTKGTYAKMARGEMVRYMAENQIEDPDDIKNFARLGYIYRDDLSSENEIVFERRK